MQKSIQHNNFGRNIRTSGYIRHISTIYRSVRLKNPKMMVKLHKRFSFPVLCVCIMFSPNNNDIYVNSTSYNTLKSPFEIILHTLREYIFRVQNSSKYRNCTV